MNVHILSYHTLSKLSPFVFVLQMGGISSIVDNVNKHVKAAVEGSKTIKFRTHIGGAHYVSIMSGYQCVVNVTSMVMGDNWTTHRFLPLPHRTKYMQHISTLAIKISEMAFKTNFSVLMQLEQCDDLLDGKLFSGECYYQCHIHRILPSPTALPIKYTRHNYISTLAIKMSETALEIDFNFLVQLEQCNNLLDGKIIHW